MNALAVRWNDWPITRKSLAVVTLPLLLLAVALMAIYSVERQNIAAENDVRQTLEVLSDLYEAHALLAETAAGVRGYRLVRRDEFLTPYRDAEPRLQGVADRLSQRITDPVQAQRFARIKPLFAEKMQGWRRLLAPDLSREEEIRQLWDGKYKLDILRAELRELRNYETAQLQVRSAKAQGLRQRNLIITLSAAMLGGLGAVFAVAWFASALSGRLRTLAANADRLGEGLPLAPQPRAGDELGQVGQRLAQASELLAARAAEAQLARREAETANHAKTEFLSRSSHELRTPLNAILGYAQVLEMDLPEPGPRRHLQHILGAGRHLLGLITELLDIARIEADQLDLSPEPVPVDAAVHEALGLIAPDADKHGIRLQPAAIEGAWTVRADAQRLRQILLNLLSNAVKFNRPGGQVQVSAQADGGQVRITVADQGQGLTPPQIERLFTPFERLGAERSAVEGTGLGLALSKKLIEAMGGQIGVDSSRDGARFWISLPQGEPHHTTPARALMPPSASASGVCRLLSIEDNPSNQALIRTLTERRPQWQLFEATSLAQARTLLQQAIPDLILLDLHLSDGSGEELLRELQAQPATAQVPVVVISADATTATLARVGNQGVRAYLTKPLDVAEFFTVIDRLLA
ncbi:CHASE3 domain-containing protein [Xanthomonas melonis]|uniref:histidine kinase n=1 Tax=Xanthomonas melonis TaxID=56456 RepID=A0A2S7DLJ2_9XANT|nr:MULTISPECIES: ATP-binding protein [Xanthomonas]MCC4588223.1 CHASE3 domain-containing protein [Xanthomonas sp. NCPPB 1067]MCC4598795.1 CHASE3 domain-containing protein [Xanthomonas melonis]MCD0245185.1 CHASE3 domain-containing protein [Xanthomonas melonis]MCD0260239.1 CHASE3 domain-containing protein [Xanthomonas melonis]MCD0268851.1 CHASE3 domain-containing protein [Xanthomonas melonis]